MREKTPLKKYQKQLSYINKRTTYKKNCSDCISIAIEQKEVLYYIKNKKFLLVNE